MAEMHHLDEWRRPEDLGEPDVWPVVDNETVEDEVIEPPAGPQGPDLEAEAREVRRALTELILSDQVWWQVFERTCQQGLVGLPERAEKLAEALRERGLAGDLPPHVLQDAVEALIPEMAAELLPESAAAAWEKLLERVRRKHPGYEEPVGAVLRLCGADPRVFRRLTHVALAEPDYEELRAAAQEAWQELRERGRRFDPEGFSAHLWVAIREIFPKAPGAAWDAGWADEVRQEVQRRLSRHAEEAGVEVAEVDISGIDAAVERMREVEEAQDRVGFRQAARQAIHAGESAVQKAAAQAS